MEKEIAWLLKEKYSGIETPGFKKDILRFKKGEPLDYVIGFTLFLGCKIDLSKKPLIPRPETEYWVGEAVSSIKYEVLSIKPKKIQVLDIFAGSGCIGISIMRHIENTRVVFAEKDKNAAAQIKINCKINHISGGKIVTADIFSNVAGKYDYIFANPPYIPTTKKSRIQKSVLNYEPIKALFGGKDGIFYIKKFLAQALDFLKPGGKIYMEFDVTQKKQIGDLLEKYGYKAWEFQKDQYGRWRWIIICNKM